MDLEEFLDFADATDKLGLLALKIKPSAPTADEHLLAKFNEIEHFITEHGREPLADMTSVTEYILHQRLAALRSNEEHCASLNAYDTGNILVVLQTKAEDEVKPTSLKVSAPMEITSLNDIFANDELGLLDDGNDSIFTIRNVPKSITMPDKMARRKRCENFEIFEPLFKQCHTELKSSLRDQRKFTGEQQIQKGQFFILHGVMCYVSDMEERVKKNGKLNAKLHLIFENGTESNMLLRSLATELYKDETGRRVMPITDNSLDDMLGVESDDTASGYIYILKSHSSKPEISSLTNLYKIGFSTTPVKQRIANAENEPTYLMAGVDHVASYECYNMNPQKFEKLLHRVFSEVCLDVEVVDSFGKLCKPREWFVVPLAVIEMAIQLLVNGEIVNYSYDAGLEELVEK